MLPDSFMRDESSLYAPVVYGCTSNPSRGDAGFGRPPNTGMSTGMLRLGELWFEQPLAPLFRVDVSLPLDDSNRNGTHACWVARGESILTYAHRTNDQWSCDVLDHGEDFMCTRMMYDNSGFVASTHRVGNMEPLWLAEQTGTLLIEYRLHHHHHHHHHLRGKVECASTADCTCGCDQQSYCDEVI
jgi:hypothetical protein